MTSAQWCYLHKNIIFLVIILILKHVLVRLMQKYLILVINCLLCCINWYSWDVIRSSHRIRMVVKFYNHTLRLRYGRIPMRYYPPLVLLLWKQSWKIIVSNKWSTFASAGFGCRTHVNQPLEILSWCVFVTQWKQLNGSFCYFPGR